MSEPIKESKEKKSAREKGMEAWAASMAARSKQQGQALGPEQELSSGGASRPGAAQRPKKLKTVTKNQETSALVKKDTVDLARSTEKSEAELTMKSARDLMKGGKTQNPQAPKMAPVVQAQAPAAKVEKAIKEAVQDEVATEAATVTAEEVQQAPSIVGTVAAKSTKKSQKSSKSESASEAKATEELEEDPELAELVKPGNSPKASAYVRAGDLMPQGSDNSDLDDFLLAL